MNDRGELPAVGGEAVTAARSQGRLRVGNVDKWARAATVEGDLDVGTGTPGKLEARLPRHGMGVIRRRGSLGLPGHLRAVSIVTPVLAVIPVFRMLLRPGLGDRRGRLRRAGATAATTVEAARHPALGRSRELQGQGEERPGKSRPNGEEDETPTDGTRWRLGTHDEDLLSQIRPASMIETVLMWTRNALAERDRTDPLAPFRDRFYLPEGLFYFDGNSLGPLPRTVRERVAKVVEQEWGEDLIRSWNTHDWIDLPRTVAAKIAPLVGAEADEVAVTDSTSVNLFKVLAAALELRPGRRVILSEREQFPTDLYMAQGLAGLLAKGHDPRLVPAGSIGKTLEEIGDEVAVVCLSHVQFKHGHLLDMAAITRAAHERGALAIWDLSHSGGALPVELDAAGADFAVGCGYKFLNGGPGAPAYVYVARRHHAAARSPLAGWFGHAAPFAFDLDYRPAPGVGRFLCGTPPILSLAALDAALDAFADVDLDAVRRKSIELGNLFLELVEARCGEELGDTNGLTIACPRDGERRGSQVSLAHPEGYAIVQALLDRGVIPDFRAPNVLRFGLTPLYLRYVDVWDAVEILAEILRERSFDDPRYRERRKVT